MLYFDWDTILKETAGDCAKIFSIISMLSYGYAPKNYRDPEHEFYGKDFFGLSYLLNPYEPLADVSKRKVTLQEFGVYLAFAAERNVVKLYREGIVYLPLETSRYPEHLIAHNRLLRLQEGNVLFKYEYDVEDLGEKRNG
jgi:hypothetical protein